MKRKLLLLPMFLLVLAACGPSTSSEPVSQDPTSEAPVTSEEPTTSEDPVTSEEPTLPPPPSTSEIPPAESMTIAQIRDITLNSTGGLDAGQIKEVRTTGTVTNVSRRASGPSYNVTIQDGEEAMLLYAIAEEDIADFGEPGDFLTVEGTLAPYKGLWELSGVKVISKEAGTAITPKALTSVAQASLKGLDSVLVKIDGLSVIAGEVVADTNEDKLTFKLNEDTIGGYLHYAIPEDVQAAIAAALVPTGDADGKIDALDTLTFTGIVDMNSGTYQLAITGPENFTNVTDGGEPAAPTEFDSVSEIRAGIKDASLAVGAVVNFEGVITSIDYNGILIQETNGGVVSAIALRGVTTPANYAVGNLVRGTGTIDIYNGLAQIAGVGTTLTVEAATGPTQGSVEITEALLGDANLVDNTNALIHGTGFLAETDIDFSALTVADKGADLVLKKGAATFKVRFDLRYNDFEAVRTILNALDVNYTLDILEGGAYLSWFKNNPQSYLIDASKLIVRNTLGEVVAGTEPEVPAETFLGKYDFSDEVRTAYVSGTKSKYEEGEFATFLMTKLVAGGTETLVSSTGEANVYTAANSFADTGPQFNGIKFGASKKTGTVTLNFAPGTNVVKIVVGAAGWSSPNTDELTIGGITLTPTLGGVTATAEELVFEFPATDTVTITANKRIIFSYISVYSELA